MAALIGFLHNFEGLLRHGFFMEKSPGLFELADRRASQEKLVDLLESPAAALWYAEPGEQGGTERRRAKYEPDLTSETDVLDIDKVRDAERDEEL